jgi:hypothetical protein
VRISFHPFDCAILNRHLNGAAHRAHKANTVNVSCHKATSSMWLGLEIIPGPSILTAS